MYQDARTSVERATSLKIQIQQFRGTHFEVRHAGMDESILLRGPIAEGLDPW